MQTAVKCLYSFLKGSKGGRTIMLMPALFAAVSAHAFLNSVENRMTYSEFAAKKLNGVPQALSLYSAAGIFSCNDGWESGTLVGRNDIVAIAAHSVMIKRKGQCVRKPALAKCYFQTIGIDGSFGRKIAIDPQTLTVSSKYLCAEKSEMQNDWAVVQLRARVQEVRGFEFEEGNTLLKGAPVYVFASHSSNFSRPNTPTICAGEIGFVWNLNKDVGTADSIGTSCSAGPGSSGGAVVAIDESSPRYVGLISAGSDDAIGVSFDINNFSAGPLLANEFYRTLMEKLSTPVVSK